MFTWGGNRTASDWKFPLWFEVLLSYCNSLFFVKSINAFSESPRSDALLCCPRKNINLTVVVVTAKRRCLQALVQTSWIFALHEKCLLSASMSFPFHDILHTSSMWNEASSQSGLLDVSIENYLSAKPEIFACRSLCGAVGEYRRSNM